MINIQDEIEILFIALRLSEILGDGSLDAFRKCAKAIKQINFKER